MNIRQGVRALGFFSAFFLIGLGAGAQIQIWRRKSAIDSHVPLIVGLSTGVAGGLSSLRKSRQSA